MGHVLKSFAAWFGFTDPQLRAPSPSEQGLVDGEPEREFIHDPSASAGLAEVFEFVLPDEEVDESWQEEMTAEEIEALTYIGPELMARLKTPVDPSENITHEQMMKILYPGEIRVLSRGSAKVELEEREEGGFSVKVDDECVGIVHRRSQTKWVARAVEDDHVSTHHNNAIEAAQALVEFARGY